MTRTSKVKIILRLVLLLGCIKFSMQKSDECPSTCECFGTIVDCSDNSLSQIPDIPSWVEELNLSKNSKLDLGNVSLEYLPHLKLLRLQSLRLDFIPDVGELPTLRSLYLTGNDLEDMNAEWTRNFPQVHELNFGKNLIDTLDFSQLDGLKLRKIDMKSNSISKIARTPSSSLTTLLDLRLHKNSIGDDTFKNLSSLFGHMPNLKSLDLNRNKIEKIEGLVFQNLSKLLTLKMKNNKITELPAGVFYGLKSLTTLRLDNNTNITEISNAWLFDQIELKILSLSHNKIETIKESAWDKTRRLTILDLNFNLLGCSRSEPNFNGLQNLVELYLSHNCFSNIDQNTFKELERLHILDLSYNSLQLSIEYNTGAFKKLKSLVVLNLAHNKIETIHSEVFNPMKSLSTLDLTGNTIKILPHNPFKTLHKLRNLDFNSSTLVCDCSLTWLQEFLKKKSSAIASQFICGFPERLKGREIVDLKKRELKCEDSPQPVISQYPKNQTALYGRNMTLQCEAHIGGENPSFTWTKNRRVVEPYHVKTYMSIEEEGNSTVTKVVSQFHIDNVTFGQEGIYQCITRNTFGPSYSPPAKVVVHRFPYFTEKPLSVEVKEGGAIEIKCAASGYPTPEILVNKKGDFPAPREKRMFYQKNVYFIKPVLARDDGVYICTARNAAGSVNTTARISVIHTPSFSRPLQNQAASIGQSVALECQGTGQPKPKVTWYHDGKRVVHDSNHVLLEDGQFLILLKVEKEDIGTYLCELTNRLGTQRRKLELMLQSDKLFPAMTLFTIMILVICIVLTSLVWLCVIFGMRRSANKKSYSKSERPQNNNNGFDPLLTPNHITTGLKRTSIKANDNSVAPLMAPPNPHTLDNFILSVTTQDSGSEHSSGKDSGVGESTNHRSNEDKDSGVGESTNHRSNEDLHRNLATTTDPSGKKNYSKLNLRGRSSLAKAPGEDLKPHLSTFTLNQTEVSQPASTSSTLTTNYNPTYASLRRGSTSRLLAVPSPVTPSMGMNSLPRQAYKTHSLSTMKHPDLYTASLSRRRPSNSSARSIDPNQIRSMNPNQIRSKNTMNESTLPRSLQPVGSSLRRSYESTGRPIDPAQIHHRKDNISRRYDASSRMSPASMNHPSDTDDASSTMSPAEPAKMAPNFYSFRSDEQTSQRLKDAIYQSKQGLLTEKHPAKNGDATYQSREMLQKENPTSQPIQGFKYEDPTYQARQIYGIQDPTYQSRQQVKNDNPAYQSFQALKNEDPTYQSRQVLKNEDPYQTRQVLKNEDPTYQTSQNVKNEDPTYQSRHVFGSEDSTYQSRQALKNEDPTYQSRQAVNNEDATYQTRQALKNEDPTYQLRQVLGNEETINELKQALKNQYPTYESRQVLKTEEPIYQAKQIQQKENSSPYRNVEFFKEEEPTYQTRQVIGMEDPTRQARQNLKNEEPVYQARQIVQNENPTYQSRHGLRNEDPTYQSRQVSRNEPTYQSRETLGSEPTYETRNILRTEEPTYQSRNNVHRNVAPIYQPRQGSRIEEPLYQPRHLLSNQVKPIDLPNGTSHYLPSR